VNDGSNFLFPKLVLSVYGNIRDASMAPKSSPCLSATPTGPANYGVTKEFAELFVFYYPDGVTKSTRGLIAVDIQHYGLRELSRRLNPQDIERVAG
jgi:hypothetical protein